MISEKIWFGEPTVEAINKLKANTLEESLDIDFIEVGKDYLKATMPVDKRTKQPFGLLHGGASVALAETIGSIASWLLVDPEVFVAVGIEINANHIKAVTKGKVTGVCKPVHIKGKTHVWDIRIYTEENDLCCISRFTCAIVAKAKMLEKIR